MMSGRRFRILSDSEDEDLAGTKATAENEKSDASSDGGTAAPTKRRRRIVAHDSSDEASDVDSAERGNGNESSVRHHDTAPLRSQNDPENSDGEDAPDGNEPHEREPDLRATPPQRSSDRESDRDEPLDNRLDQPSSYGNPHGNSYGNSQEDSQGDPDENPDGNKSVNENEGDGERPASPAADAEEAQEAPERRIVKKRIIRNPQPKLDANRLTGERGLGRLRNMHPTLRLKGKGHEHEDLKCVLHNLQLWGHRMFPKMQTKEIFDRCERLGAKIPVRVYLRRMRNGEIHDFNKPIVDSGDEVSRGVDGNDDMPPVDQYDAFNGAEEEPPPVDSNDMFEELLEQRDLPAQTPTAAIAPGNTQDDLKAKIEAKKMEALRRREELRALREAQQREEQLMEAQMSLQMEAVDGVGN